MTRLGHAPPLPLSCGDLIVDAGEMSSSKQIRPGTQWKEAVQIEAGEAVQIEEQARVLDRVIRDTPNTRLPATAWPRQTLAAYTARPSRGHGGKDEGRLLALMQGPSRGNG